MIAIPELGAALEWWLLEGITSSCQNTAAALTAQAIALLFPAIGGHLQSLRASRQDLQFANWNSRWQSTEGIWYCAAY